MEHSCQIEQRIKEKTNAATERTNAKNRQNRSGEVGAGKLCEQQTERHFPSRERERERVSHLTIKLTIEITNKIK